MILINVATVELSRKVAGAMITSFPLTYRSAASLGVSSFPSASDGPDRSTFGRVFLPNRDSFPVDSSTSVRYLKVVVFVLSILEHFFRSPLAFSHCSLCMYRRASS